MHRRSSSRTLDKEASDRKLSERMLESKKMESMRPTIARMMLDVEGTQTDLGYGDMGLDDKNKKFLGGRGELLQNRVAELLVFEIRKGGETQFKTLSVRGLYKYVMKAIKFGDHHHPNNDSSKSINRRPPIVHSSSGLGTVEPQPFPPPTNRTTTDGNNNNDSDDHNDKDPEKPSSYPTFQSKDLEGSNRSVTFGGDQGPMISEQKEFGTAHPSRIPEEKEYSSTGGSSNTSSTARAGGEGIIATSYQERHRRQVSNVSVLSGAGADMATHVTYRERLGGFLHPRDMRRLCTPFSSSNEPELIVRRHVMLLNFDPLRAVILRDRVLVIVPSGADSLLSDLENRVRGGYKEVERSIFGDRDAATDIGDSSHGGTSTRQTPRRSTFNNPQQHNAIVSSVHGATAAVVGAAGAVVGATAAVTQTVTRTAVDVTRTAVDVTVKMPIALAKKATDSLKDTITGRTSIKPGGLNRSTSLNTSDDDSVHSYIASEYREWEEMESRGWVDLPFELQCVDAVLSSVISILGKDTNELKLTSIQAMDDLLNSNATSSGSGGDEMLRHLKNSLQEMRARVEGFTRALNLLLDESEDMALMNLSRLLTHPERFIQPVPEEVLEEESDEPELILEAHLQTALSLTNSLDLIRGEIQTTQEMINQRLDSVRNRLLLANMIISVGSFCVGLGSFVGSIFGMNVTNHMESDPDKFMQIVIATCVGMLGLVLLFGLVLWYAGTLPSLRSSF